MQNQLNYWQWGIPFQRTQLPKNGRCYFVFVAGLYIHLRQIQLIFYLNHSTEDALYRTMDTNYD